MVEGLIYFRDGEVIAESGNAKVYKMNNELFLEIGPGHNLWTLESELKDYIWQLSDHPRGDCLEIGLGLGIASRYLLSFPRVKSLTTVEKNEDVIKVQKKVNFIDDERHTILNADGLYYAYMTKKKYDFIFLDFYAYITEETLPLIADMAVACRRILQPEGKIMGWLDEYTSEEHVKAFSEIFDGLVRSY
jgi:spermidine synthase